jgi:hypothetical protein
LNYTGVLLVIAEPLSDFHDTVTSGGYFKQEKVDAANGPMSSACYVALSEDE